MAKHSIKITIFIVFKCFYLVLKLVNPTGLTKSQSACRLFKSSLD